jgi:hypothetical protein
MRTELAHLVRVLEERRGNECDMHHLSRYYALDVSGERTATFSSFLSFVRSVTVSLAARSAGVYPPHCHRYVSYSVDVVVFGAPSSVHRDLSNLHITMMPSFLVQITFAFIDKTFYADMTL